MKRDSEFKCFCSEVHKCTAITVKFTVGTVKFTVGTVKFTVGTVKFTVKPLNVHNSFFCYSEIHCDCSDIQWENC